MPLWGVPLGLLQGLRSAQDPKGGEAVLGTDRLLVEVHPELCRPDQPFDWSPIWSSGQSRASRRL